MCAWRLLCLLLGVDQFCRRWYRFQKKFIMGDNYYVKTFNGAENLPDHILEKVIDCPHMHACIHANIPQTSVSRVCHTPCVCVFFCRTLHFQHLPFLGKIVSRSREVNPSPPVSPRYQYHYLPHFRFIAEDRITTLPHVVYPSTLSFSLIFPFRF